MPPNRAATYPLSGKRLGEGGTQTFAVLNITIFFSRMQGESSKGQLTLDMLLIAISPG
jgi:hypothetical protein